MIPAPGTPRVLRNEATPRVTVSPRFGVVFTALALVLPRAALAQAVPVAVPKNIIFPNYDKVFIGPMEALEAGASMDFAAGSVTELEWRSVTLLYALAYRL